MKKVCLLSLCLIGALALNAQVSPEPADSPEFDFKKLELELEQMMKEVHAELKNLDIDLSGLEKLHEIEWKKHLEDSEALAYLESEEFKQEMARVQQEVDAAMAEVKIEMEQLKSIEWNRIQEEVQRAMEEAHRAMEEVHRSKKKSSEAY